MQVWIDFAGSGDRFIHIHHGYAALWRLAIWPRSGASDTSIDSRSSGADFLGVNGRWSNFVRSRHCA
jgi:ammonia channel protein AmtB